MKIEYRVNAPLTPEQLAGIFEKLHPRRREIVLQSTGVQPCAGDAEKLFARHPL